MPTIVEYDEARDALETALDKLSAIWAAKMGVSEFAAEIEVAKQATVWVDKYTVQLEDPEPEAPTPSSGAGPRP